MSVMNAVKIRKPYKLVDFRSLYIPIELLSRDLRINFSSYRPGLIHIDGRSEPRIIRRPYISIDTQLGEWIYYLNGVIVSCSEGECSIMARISRGIPVYLFKDLIAVYRPESREIEFYRNFDENNIIHKISSVRYFEAVYFRELGILFISSRRKTAVLNDKIYDIKNFCVRRSDGIAVVGLELGRRSFVIYGEEFGSFRYLEVFGRVTDCFLGDGIGSVVLNNEKTLAIDIEGSYEISDPVSVIARNKDQIIALNNLTRWLVLYGESSMKHITKIDPDEEVRFIGGFEDSIILRIGGTLRIFRGSYSKILDKLSENDLVSFFRGGVVIERGDRLEILDPENSRKKSVDKKSNIRCIGYRKNVYCIDREHLYSVDLFSEEEVVIGEIDDRGFIRISREYPDIDLAEVLRGRIIRRNTESIIIPQIPVDGEKIVFKAGFLLGSDIVEIELPRVIKPVKILEGYIQFSRKGLHKKCYGKPLLRISTAIENPDIFKYYNYRIVVESRDRVLEKDIGGKDLESNRILEYCIDRDLHINSFYESRYKISIVAKDSGGEFEKVLDSRELDLVEVDASASINFSGEEIVISIDGKNLKSYESRIEIKCNEYSKILERRSEESTIRINLGFEKNLCKGRSKIDLWISGEDYLWGFSRKINLEEPRRIGREDLINMLRLSSEERILRDYRVIILPRELQILVEVSSDSYYILYNGSLEGFGKLQKGINIIRVREPDLSKELSIELFDGVLREILLIRPRDFRELLQSALHHALHLRETLTRLS
ncbi:MAG: hypothetical protein QXE32_01925 [Sulfolobales archaeon]